MVSIETTRHSMDFRHNHMSSFRAQEPAKEGGSKKLVRLGQGTLGNILGKEEADRKNARNSKAAWGSELPHPPAM